jgi:hypothetical protein
MTQDLDNTRRPFLAVPPAHKRCVFLLAPLVKSIPGFKNQFAAERSLSIGTYLKRLYLVRCLPWSLPASAIVWTSATYLYIGFLRTQLESGFGPLKGCGTDSKKVRHTPLLRRLRVPNAEVWRTVVGD